MLIVFIVIALYRRYKQFLKEKSMRRRAAKYAKKKKLVKRTVKRMGPNGEMMDVEIEIEVTDNDEAEVGDEGDAFALNVDPAAGPPKRGTATDFDSPMGDDEPAPPSDLDEEVLADFKKEFQPTVVMTEKQRAREEREGKGAKLRALDIGQFNRQDESENPHLMPTKKKENFVEDILDKEKGPKLKRLQSMSMLFTEALREKGTGGGGGDATGGTQQQKSKTSSFDGGNGRGMQRNRSLTASEMARNVMAMAEQNEQLRGQLEEDGVTRLGNGDSDVDPTAPHYKEMCRRASAIALGQHLAAGDGEKGPAAAVSAQSPTLPKRRSTFAPSSPTLAAGGSGAGSGGGGFSAQSPDVVFESEEGAAEDGFNGNNFKDFGTTSAAGVFVGGFIGGRNIKKKPSTAKSDAEEEKEKKKRQFLDADPTKVIGRYRRGYDEEGLPSGNTPNANRFENGLVMDPKTLGTVREESTATDTTTATGEYSPRSRSGKTSPSAAKYIAAKTRSYLPDFESYDFSPMEGERAAEEIEEGVGRAADAESELKNYNHNGPTTRPAIKLPLTAAGATGVAAPIKVTRKTGLNALDLGDEMNDFDNFEAAEDYDYRFLPGKAASAIRAEEVLATEMKGAVAGESAIRSRMTGRSGLTVGMGGVGGSAMNRSAGQQPTTAANGAKPAFDAFGGDDVLAGLDIDADIDAIAAALFQSEGGVTPYEQETAAVAVRPTTSQAASVAGGGALSAAEARRQRAEAAAKGIEDRAHSPAAKLRMGGAPSAAGGVGGEFDGCTVGNDADFDDMARPRQGGQAEEQTRPMTVKPSTAEGDSNNNDNNTDAAVDNFETIDAIADDLDFGDLVTEGFTMRPPRADVTKEEFDQNVDGLFDDLEDMA